MSNNTTLTVSSLASGASVVMTHGLDDVPCFCIPEAATPITVTAVSATTVTFTNGGPTEASATFRLLTLHSIVVPPAFGTAAWIAMSNTAALAYWKNNRVTYGIVLGAGSSPATTQGSGAVAASVRFSTTTGMILVNGLLKTVLGATSNDPGVSPPILAVGESAVLALVAAIKDGVATGPVAVWGEAGAPGVQPTSSAIAAVLQAGGYLTSCVVRIGLVQINRTGDTTITVTADNTWSDR